MATGNAFISYSRKQFYIAEQLARSLEQNGVTAWIDVQEIAPGDDWQLTIDQGLRDCQALVVLASNASYRSAAVQHEVSVALATGKPIYLAVIEDSPFVATLEEVATVFDCRSQFLPNAKNLALALQRGKTTAVIVRHKTPFSLVMPFGRAKYIQLLLLNLIFLLGTGAIILSKDVVILDLRDPHLLPFFVEAIIPLAFGGLSFVYAFLLLVRFRLQRRVTYLELELWPAICVFILPASFFILLLFSTGGTVGSPTAAGFGPVFNAMLDIRDRATGPLPIVEFILLLGAFGSYVLFLCYTLRGWLLFGGWIAVIGIYNITIIPLPIRLLLMLFVGGAIAFFALGGFLNGQEVPVAFGERRPKFDLFTIYVAVFSNAYPQNIAWGRWLSPGAFPNETFLRARHLSNQQSRDGRLKTWRLHYVPADSGSARSVRRCFADYVALDETTTEEAEYHIALLSNKTPRQWIAALAAKYPHLICIILSSLDIRMLAPTLHQNQWIDYRQQQPEQLHYLARALTGTLDNVNPTTPENFLRLLCPYPVKLIADALRLLGLLTLALGVAAQALMAQTHVALVPLPLVVSSIVLGACGWWEAGKLLRRNAFLPKLLLTFGALALTLVAWVVSRAATTLLPREVWASNGQYNSTLTTGFIVMAIFGGIPFVLVQLVALIELLRNLPTLQGWLPRANRPKWQRTLALAPWRHLNFSYIVYPLAALVLIASLVVNSPYRYPQLHEFDLPQADMAPVSLLNGPDGNIWFAQSNGYSYRIGSITPDGQIQARQISVPEPADCFVGTTSGFDCTTGHGLQVGPDRNLWYVTRQIFFPYLNEIRRSTLAGDTTLYPLPDDSINVSLAFDVAGNLWFTRTQFATLTSGQGTIGRLDHSGHIVEYPLVANSIPTSVVAGPDGNLWFFDDGTKALAKITPQGQTTEYPLSYTYPPKKAGFQEEKVIVGADHDLWFTDPQAGVIGRITTAGAITLVTDDKSIFPLDPIAGQDGGIWFRDTAHSAVGHVAANGQLALFPVHAPGGPPSSLTLGPDGNVWATLYAQVARFSPQGAITLYDVPTMDANVGSIVSGPDHHLWFGESAGLIGELIP